MASINIRMADACLFPGLIDSSGKSRPAQRRRLYDIRFPLLLLCFSYSTRSLPATLNRHLKPFEEFMSAIYVSICSRMKEQE